MSSHENMEMDLFPEDQKKVARDIAEQAHLTLYSLSKIKGLGYTTLRRIFETFPNVEEIWAASQGKLEDIMHRSRLKNPKKIIENIQTQKEDLLEKGQIELSLLKERGISLITYHEPSFPDSLRKIKNPPYWLFVEGNQEILLNPYIVAVVGTRNPTLDGIDNSRILTRLLVDKGLIVLSGLADGIDTIVHQTVVDEGGRTIAVLGTGISFVFPAGSAQLRREIVQGGGAIITEYLPNDRYEKKRFIQRNRIQAAMSQVVFPIQGGEKGGTSHTINFAVGYSKEVIGVKRNSTNLNIEQNYVLKTLDNLNCPIINLDEDRQKLWNILKPVLASVPVHEIERQKEDIFISVIKEFEYSLKYRKVSKDELIHLLDRLKDIFKRKGGSIDS